MATLIDIVKEAQDEHNAETLCLEKPVEKISIASGVARSLNGHDLSAVLRMNHAIWIARSLIASGHSFRDEADLIRFLRQSSSNPSVTYHESRQRNVLVPTLPPDGAELYRGDGAARGQRGQGDIVSGFG